MKRGRLIFFAILIITVLAVSIFVISKNDNSVDDSIVAQSTEFKGNTEKLVDFGANVMRYGNNVYFKYENKNMLLKYDPDNALTTIVHKFHDVSYGKRFFIRNNKIFENEI